MDIPNIMAGYGEDSGSSILDALIKPVSVKSKDKKKDLLNVFINLNIDNKIIEFSIIPYDNESEKKYNYFGNNSAASKQMYATRDVNSLINFWVGRPKGILKNVLDSLGEGELKELLNKCYELGLFDDNGLNTDLILLPNKELKVSIDSKKKDIYLNNEMISSEELINKCINIGLSSKVVLVIPCIIENKNKVTISTHEDYINMIINSLKGSKSSAGVCHICGQKQTDINTKEYSSILSRSSICKVFVTTTVNYAPLFSKDGHQRNYAMCKECYEKLKIGEKKVMNEFKIKIAGEDSIILFEGIINPLGKNNIEKIKKGIDLVFNPRETQDWIEGFKFELSEFQNVDLYEFNIIFYKTDGKSTIINKTIENISSIRFEYIKNAFEEVRIIFDEKLKIFTLGSIYSIVPVSTNNKGIQINIARLLDLYSAIIKGELIDRNLIYDLACEALDRGLNELRSSTVRNYRNLYKLTYLHDKDYGIDIYINKIMMSYIALFHVMQKLNIIDKEVFKMNDRSDIGTDLPTSIKESEEFLTLQGFSHEAKGLFYLGALLYQIGNAQYKQDHKTKPILDKITYSGMNNYDVLTLYMEILEKIRQYKKYVNHWLCERIEKQLHCYLGNLENVKLFNEKENVFFIMAGYAYCVDNFKKVAINEDKNNEMEDESNDKE